MAYLQVSGVFGNVSDVPSAQIFSSTANRDAYFSANPDKLMVGTPAVILTNPPEGLYQVFTGSEWQNRTAVIVGPKGDEPFKTVKVTMLPAGSAATSDINGTELDLGIPRASQSPAVRQAVRFLGMFETEAELNLQEPSPREGSQCVVLTPTQNYYEFTKGAWTKGREVGDAHNGYLGRYADEAALKLAHPTATADSTAIASKAWFIYETNAWEPLQDDHIPAIDNKLQSLEEGQQVLQSNIDQKIGGIHVEDEEGNSFDDIKSLAISGATVTDSGGTQEVNLNIKPKITVANGQGPSSSSETGNAIVIEGSTVEADPNDPNVILVNVPIGSGINLGDGVNQSREVQTVILRGHEAYGAGNTAEIHLEFAHFKTITERDAWSTKFGQGMNFDTVAVVDVGDNGAISWYKFNAATKAWEDYEIIHKGNQVLSVGQQWGDYHSVSKVYDIETQYPIEVATGKQNPSDPEEKVAILTIKPGVYEPHHSNACLLKLDMVESIAGQRPHNIYMTEEVVPTGTFFNLNSQNQGIDVQDNTGGDTALTGGQLTEALVKVEFLDSAPEDGNVKVWLEYKDPSDPIDKKILLDVNGVPLAVEKQFKANDKIGYFVLAGGFLAKATQTLKVVVETSFSSNSKITLDPLNTMVCLNQFGDGYETSIARIEFLRRAALQITPAIQKFSSTMLSLVDELDGITEGPTTITAGTGYDTLNEFGIQNLTDVSVEIKDNAMTVKDAGSIADFYFDTLIDNTHTRMLRGKQVSSAITIANPNNAFEFEAYKWTGKPDAVTQVYSSRTDGNININDGWTVIKGIFIAEQVNGNAYGHTLTFDVPDDANNIIVLVRPQSSQSPSTMMLSGFDWGSSEFTGYVEIERYNIREEHLRFDESYAEYLYTNEGYAATRYTINNTPPQQVTQCLSVSCQRVKLLLSVTEQ